MTSTGVVYIVSIPFLAVFVVGMYQRVSFWLEGGLGGGKTLTKPRKCARIVLSAIKVLFSPRILIIVESIVLDYLLGRRAFRENKVRWAMHSLLLWGFLGLMVFDAIEVSYIRSGMGEEAIKDVPHLAFAFDLWGSLILAGVVIAVLRRTVFKVKQLQNTSLDVAAIVLLAVVLLSGFLVEGFRFLMLDTPPEATGYAFVGRLISAAGTPGGQWSAAYQALWYVHMLTSLTFVAYIPFGKFLHLFAAPLSIAVNNLSDREAA